MNTKIALSLLPLLLLAHPAAAQVASSDAVSSAPKKPAPPPITAQMSSSSSLAGSANTGGKPGGASPAVSTGWNYVHATHCLPYYNGSTQYMYLYPSEGGYWFTTLSFFADTFASQCALGNWIAIYVTDSSSGSFNQVYTYNYK